MDSGYLTFLASTREHKQDLFNQFKMSKVSDITAYLTSLACFIFLVFQATKCVIKFGQEPKGTDVIIAESSRHPYPTLTICPIASYNENPDYKEALDKCNLSHDEYFNQAKWIGSGSESYCQNPKELYEQIMGKFDTLVNNVAIMVEGGQVFLNSTSDFQAVDRQENGRFGRCFSFEMPQNTRISNLLVETNDGIEVRFHSPGNFYNEDNRYTHVRTDNQEDIDLIHEVFEVLDYEGEPCMNYPNGSSRDTCIEDLMVEKSMEMVGCTAPYVNNKSSICEDLEKAKLAHEVYAEIRLRAFLDKIPNCPKSCQFLMINFGRTHSVQPIDKPIGELFLRFQRYIKVSKVGFTYRALELFAEFGGYLGLLLGISINQLPGMVDGCFIKIKKYCKSSQNM